MGLGDDVPVDKAGTIARANVGWHVNAFLDKGSPVRTDIVRVGLSTGVVSIALRHVGYSAWFAVWDLHFQPMDRPREDRTRVESSDAISKKS